MDYVADTHVGLERKTNEDAFRVGENILVVCDGLGGHDDGEIASFKAAEVCFAQLSDGEDMAVALMAANDAVDELAGDMVGRRRMGTTIVAAVRDEDGAMIGWAGDSRAYGVRKNGGVDELTQDHAELFSGLLNFAGIGGGFFRPSLTHASNETYSRIVLCTDGLTNFVEDLDEMRDLMREPSNEKALRALIALALAGGGGDNITVAILDL